MTKFQMSRADAPYDYPTLGFRADTSNAIIDGTLSSPALTVPPDAFWSVYVGGSAETGITRYQSPAVGPAPAAETPDGYMLVYRDASNRFVPTEPTEFLGIDAVADALSATYVRFVRSDTGAPLPAGRVTIKVDPATHEIADIIWEA